MFPLNSSSLCLTAFSRVTKSFSLVLATAPKAHAMAVISRALNSRTRSAAAPLTAANSFFSEREAVANAHAVFEMSYGVKSLSRRSADRPKADIIFDSEC
eukprot:gnl/TRDRNA2_/TRDRNA2_164422_c0_seq2.p1 gnl/TRDRNA2_/TRDRNA2_164422_c0~~gnl/TRDRNA2_/TRDRNA2_164422_c0_seq2.p1  ORF type:complete len:100 (+),score=9.43 gnl/TRDRNA2_/TRDRNA2_164422_c0_seq2:133-432(+)